MLALIYLALAIYLGDLLCRRFYRFVSIYHRWAAAVLVGILLSTWFTYLAGLAFMRTAKPLLWADLLFFAIGIGTFFWVFRKHRKVQMIEQRSPGSSIWDWTTLVVLTTAVCILLVGTMHVSHGMVRLTGMQFSDFGPNSAIAQSFALGHNFPTQYPHYSGQPIHYHFLFYFQAGNLEFLGLHLAWAVDILSVLGLISMLALVMALGELLFNSRVVGRLGAGLFFFHGAPMVIPFLKSQPSIQSALNSIVHLQNFLPTGYPYRGETWGIWTQIVFVNQRHLPSGIGILLLVLIFLIDQYRQRTLPIRTSSSVNPGVETSSIASTSSAEPNAAARPKLVTTARNAITHSESFIFSGFLLGTLPLWQAPVFPAAAAVLFFLLILFPYRWQMVMLGITAAVFALPQILFLHSGEVAPTAHPLLHFGYTLDNPTVRKVINYVAFTFALKWSVILIALIFGSWFQRRFFLALCSLFLLTFCTQFSAEALANHKYLNTWLVVANLFAAYGLWLVWKLKTPPILGPIAATALTATIVLGGVIDLFPIYNSSFAVLDYKKDPLVQWVRSHTKPDAVFLSDYFVNHQILLAGRKIFFGWPYFTWGAGYDLAKREPIYRQMFESKNPRLIFELLKQNGIDYVAFDNAVRSHSEKVKKPNEQLYSTYFEKVYEDKENRYGRLVIYKVPDSLPASLEGKDLSEPPVTAFEGGRGTSKGQFDSPRAVAVGADGKIFVADTNNGRIEEFSPTGVFIKSMGRKGIGYGEFGEPNGLAIDHAGNIYVAEGSNHRVQKLAPDGTFIAELKGPDPGFYGPRKIAAGPDDSIYVVDQGRARIVKFSPDGQALATWGSKGNGDGQFDDPTSVAVDPTTNKVYVADPRNKRIQVFDANGTLLNKWLVPEWGAPYGYEALAVDSERGRLYASSAIKDTVLVFDLNGSRVGVLRPKPPDKLDGSSALALTKDKFYVLNASSARLSVIDLPKAVRPTPTPPQVTPAPSVTPRRTPRKSIKGR
jgi:DNA-binding beta-propeller fold protein YncE